MLNKNRSIIASITFVLLMISIYYVVQSQDRDSDSLVDSNMSIYEVESRGFSFAYPSDATVNEQSDFINVSNYDSNRIQRGLSDGEFVVQFLYEDGVDFDCQNLLSDIEVSKVGNSTVYRGFTLIDENSGAGGWSAVCINRAEESDVFAQGSEKKVKGSDDSVVEKVLNSIKF